MSKKIEPKQNEGVTASEAMDPQSLPAWLTPGQVLAWIDRRTILPPDEWMRAFAPERSFAWGVPIDDGRLAAAFDRLAGHHSAAQETDPRREPEVLPLPYDERAADILKTTGDSPSVLADRVRSDMKKDVQASQRLKAARAALRQALANGKLSAVGRRVANFGDRSADEPPMPVPPAVFADDGVDVHPSAVGHENPPFFGGWIGSEQSPGGWVSVRLSGESVVAIWPDAGSASPATKASAPTRSGSRSVTDAALKAFFLKRRNKWPSGRPAPTEAEDRRAAEEHFRCRISRDKIREFRRKYGVEGSTKPGPRGPRRSG